jgi:hypothetical protein
MNKQVQRTEKSGSAKAVSVADYIVERLAAEGIDHCFGGLCVPDLRCSGQQCEGEVDRLCQRVECILRA